MKTPATAHMSSMNGVVGWLRRILGGPHPHAQNATPRPRPTAAAVTKPAAEPRDPRWGEFAPEFAAHAHALGLEFRSPAPLADAQLTQVAQLSAAVLSYAENDDSGPTSLPTAALRVLNLVAKSDVEMTELSTAIQQDPALTAAVLRVANSAASGSASTIDTVRDAIVRLGLRESERIAGAVAAKALFSPRSKAARALYGSQFGQLHVEAASAAGGAAYLAMERGSRSDLAYLGGMLHDVGKSIGLGALAGLVLSGRAPRDLSPEVVQAILNQVNVELGALAHDRWGLPEYLTAICAAQHDPVVPEGPSHVELHLVRVVSGLLALRTAPQPLERIGQLAQSLAALRMSTRETRALDAELRKRVAQVRQALGA